MFFIFLKNVQLFIIMKKMCKLGLLSQTKCDIICAKFTLITKNKIIPNKVSSMKIGNF